LAAIEASLTGADDAVAPAAGLRRALAARGLSSQHMLDLIEAFRRDVTKSRYADWGELIDYCRYSAWPVGRFVLDVHGESRAAWPASDALCGALQVINHLQDCGEDYRALDRVYLPTDDLTRAGLTAAALGEPRAGPALLGVIGALSRRVEGLLGEARALGPAVRDLRLSLEIGVIEALARSLNRRLARRDPLAQRVHHRPIEALGVALLGAGRSAGARLFAPAAP
ncbi:MAG: squalene/phytoene synthase family protein, partial [Caulobacteraceae bacterium]|nr:squalene/phytoene synthase family protein [Caulobacteraceae bacterium]